jgi:hypothetical protein
MTTGKATAAQDESDDVAGEYAEAAIQALHVEDLLEHIPVVKTALMAAKIIGSVRDHLLLKKLAVYLHAISIIPAAERRAMVARLAADSNFNENVGEHLIELLDRVDGRRKPAMIGAVFAAYAFENIDAKTLLRLNAAVQNLPAMEFKAVRLLGEFNQVKGKPAEAPRARPDRLSMQAIANAGLAEPDSVPSGIGYRLNETGNKFLELELDKVNPAA